MNRYLVFIVITLSSLSVTACSPNRSVKWKGHTFLEVASLRAVPASILRALRADAPGFDGIADRGKPFNATDVVTHDWPMRRLLGAGHDGNMWLLAIEHGGRGYNVQVYLFSGPSQKYHCALLANPRSLADVVSLLKKGKCLRM